MKYIIETMDDELMVTPEELEAYSRRLWEEEGRSLYLNMVVQDTMYFGITE